MKQFKPLMLIYESMHLPDGFSLISGDGWLYDRSTETFVPDDGKRAGTIVPNIIKDPNGEMFNPSEFDVENLVLDKYFGYGIATGRTKQMGPVESLQVFYPSKGYMYRPLTVLSQP